MQKNRVYPESEMFANVVTTKPTSNCCYDDVFGPRTVLERNFFAEVLANEILDDCDDGDDNDDNDNGDGDDDANGHRSGNGHLFEHRTSIVPEGRTNGHDRLSDEISDNQSAKSNSSNALFTGDKTTAPAAAPGTTATAALSKKSILTAFAKKAFAKTVQRFHQHSFDFNGRNVKNKDRNRMKNEVSVGERDGDGNDGDDDNNDDDDDDDDDDNYSRSFDPETLYFRDGQRKIDMVLVYGEDWIPNDVNGYELDVRMRKRTVFQENLLKEGLELELEKAENSFDGKTNFLKVHLPWKTKKRYAELMGLKLPIKRLIPITFQPTWMNTERVQHRMLRPFRRLFDTFKRIRAYNLALIDKNPSFYSDRKNAAGGANDEQFLVKDRATSFCNSQRSLIVMQILSRVKYDDSDKAGIRRLLNDGTFISCFPLHEGSYDRDIDGEILDRRDTVYKKDPKILDYRKKSIRWLLALRASLTLKSVFRFYWKLYLEWGRIGAWYKKQPIFLIKKYFGDKIALYFCWLGFYTKLLYFPAVVGTVCFLYGVLTLESDANIPSREICDSNGPGNITLCPMCDKVCQFQKLKDSCLFSQITYLFDNFMTVFFAIFMCIWAIFFLELWKRKQNVLKWEWDLQDVETDQESRPEFETSVRTYRINPVTREREPYLSTYSRLIRFTVTGSAVFLMMTLVLATVLGTIIYRLSFVMVIYSSGGPFLKTHAKIFSTMSAAMLNLIIIMLLTRVYHRLAIILTNLENPRTQTEYEDSFIFKIFLFEFINYYSSLIYIAFFKGRFYDHPGNVVSRKSILLRVKGDICDPAGCLSELCIQLAIIMIGKQFLNNIIEVLNPLIGNWWRFRAHNQLTKNRNRIQTRWEKDYHLQDPGRLALFEEYLEMILQYGFITLFVSAFPLAPLFALLNNIVEIRLDAYKFVTQARRPLAERAENIGAWYGILKIITYTSIVSNAFVIAYTSEFIPRMVYKFKYSSDFNLIGYIDNSLSLFNTSDYVVGAGPAGTEDRPLLCQYRGYRNAPNDTNAYELSSQYWHVFAARLAFVVFFEHVVFATVAVMRYAISDTPSELNTQIQREELLAKEAKYEHGLKYYELDAGSQNSSGNLESLTRRENGTRSITGSKQQQRRRKSIVSGGFDAHVNIDNQSRNLSLNSDV